jgi:glucosamine 6-phosphate synthetase-like amidotransferase/phosphosugar isomerase protein
MCGIAGALLYADAATTLFFEAVRACRSRGEDSFGLLCWSPLGGWKELRRFSCKLDDWVASFRAQDWPCFYLHTSRAEPTTEYKEVKSESDIPPFRTASIAVAHNGIIANDTQLVRRYDLHPCSEIDTAIMPDLVAQLGFWQALRQIRGGCAFAVVDADRRTLYLARNFLPLTIVWQPGIIAFASERSFFPKSNRPFPPYRIWDVPAYTGIEFSTSGYGDPVRWGDVPDPGSTNQWNSFPNC